MRVVFVHGACVRDGQWWWHRTAAELKRSGVASTAPLLPSCGETGLVPGVDGPSLAEDVASVREHLLSLDEPVVVVAHSYGGTVVAEAADRLPQVRHLLAVASVLPRVGESQASFGDGTLPPFLAVREDGTFGVRPELATQTFLQDCSPEDVQAAHERLVWQTASVTGQPVRGSAWTSVPSTYLVCGDDRGTPPDFQREQARRAGRVVELAAGHHVMLSQPRALAELVLGLAA